MLFQGVDKRKKLICSFPKALHDDVIAVLKTIPQKAYIPYDMSEDMSTYTLSSGKIQFPYRVYFYEPTSKEMYSLTKQQQDILHCVYSRSHDGYMREKHITALLSTDFPEWVIPYIVKVCDEYVIDILQVVYTNLKGKNTAHIKQFCADNHASFYRSYNRMISYWNAFYRHNCHRYEDYVGRKLFIECFGAKRTMKCSK